MKRLKRLLLINWLYFSKQMIELDDVNFLTGKNGAGKSTIIDALQIVLLGETNARNFNKAANDKSQRTLDDYLRAAWDENNPNARKGKDFSSYIACEYWDDINGTRFVTGVVFDCRSDGTRREQFFMYNGVIPEDQFIRGGVPMEISALRKYLKELPNARGKMFDTQSQYRLDLLAKWNVHREQTFRMLKKAVSFQPITDIQKFITENICDIQERPDIEEMQQNIRNYKRHEEMAEREEEKLEHLTRIAQLYREWQTATDRFQQQRFLVHWAEKADTQGKIEQRELEQQDCGRQLEALDTRLVGLKRDMEQQTLRRDQLNAARANSDVYREQERLKEARERLTKEQQELAGRLERTAMDIKKEAQSLCRVSDEILGWEAEEALQPLTEAAGELNRAYLPFCDCTSEVFAGEEALFTQANAAAVRFLDAARAAAYLVETQLSEQKKEKDRLEGDLAGLRRNVKDYPQGMLELRRILQAELTKKLGRVVTIHVLADVLELADGEEQWRGAVEGYLNTQKFHLLVPIDAYEQAASLYERIKRQFGGKSFGLVDIEKLREKEKLVSWDDSLARKIVTKNELARSYVDYLLGRVVCVSHVSQLRRHRTALTADGMLYRGYVLRPLPRAQMEDAFIGQKAVALRIRQAEERLSECEKAIQTMQPVAEMLNRQKSRESLFTERFIRGEIPDRKEDRRRGYEIAREVDALEEDLSRLDLGWLLDINEQLQQAERELRRIEQDALDASMEKGRIEGRRKQLEEEIIPALYEKLIEKEDFISEEFSAAFQQETGLPRYAQELSRLGNAEIVAKNFGDQLERTRREVDHTRNSLLKAREDYVRAFQPCAFLVEAMDNREFSEEQRRLEESELPKYREKIKRAKESAMEQFQNDFLAKLKSSIDQVRKQVDDLNKVLKHGQFGTDRYRFLVERNPDYIEYYDMIMAPELMEGEGGLFALPFQQKYGPRIEELFSRIATSDDTQLNARKQSELQQNIERYTDFRTYLRFDLETTDQNGNKQLLSKSLHTKSGGETQTPFYIAVLASFAQLYQVNNLSSAANNTMRLVVFDEAFNKMDSDRIIESVRLLRKMGLQAIVCTPPEKLADIAPQADRTLLVGKRGYEMFVLPYTKEAAETWNEK